MTVTSKPKQKHNVLTNTVTETDREATSMSLHGISPFKSFQNVAYTACELQ